MFSFYLEIILLLLDPIFGVVIYKNLNIITASLIGELVYKDFDFLELFF